ncbi:MAG: hypothetical protein K6G30_14745, partial [Acetatifactor sp.]|nr:hypothetical protein [Acetatifactor sp.]
MKLLKKLFNFILLIIALICGFVLVCAFNPELTQSLAEKVNALQNFNAAHPEITDTISLTPTEYVVPSQEIVEVPESVQNR